MAAVCKQLEAAQSFLKQVSKLPNFDALRDKQQVALLSVLKKTSVLNLKDANSIFQMMDENCWTPEQIDALRVAVSQRLQTEEAKEDPGKRGPKSQDFQNFLGFLKPSQWTSLQASGSVSSGCSMLVSMLAQLGLRYPSEWTFGTMYCFMHLVLGLQVPDASKAYSEITKLKPAIRKQLEGLPEPSVFLLQLPKTPLELPSQFYAEVYGSETPCEGKISKELLLFTASQISVRKSGDKVLDKAAPPQVPVDPMQAMATTATALMATFVATHGPQAGAASVGATAAAGSAAGPLVRMPSRPMLALCDAPPETAEEVGFGTGKQEAAEKAADAVAEAKVPQQDSLASESLGPGSEPKGKAKAFAKAKAKAKAKTKVKAKAKAHSKGKPAAALKRPASATSSGRSIKEVPGLTWQAIRLLQKLVAVCLATAGIAVCRSELATAAAASSDVQRAGYGRRCKLRRAASWLRPPLLQRHPCGELATAAAAGCDMQWAGYGRRCEQPGHGRAMGDDEEEDRRRAAEAPSGAKAAAAADVFEEESEEESEEEEPQPVAERSAWRALREVAAGGEEPQQAAPPPQLKEGQEPEELRRRLLASKPTQADKVSEEASARGRKPSAEARPSTRHGSPASSRRSRDSRRKRSRESSRKSRRDKKARKSSSPVVGRDRSQDKDGEPPVPPPEKWLDHELELVRETLYFIMQFRSVGNRDVLAKCIGVLACLRTMWTDVESWLQTAPDLQLECRIRELRLTLGIVPQYFGMRLGREFQIAFSVCRDGAALVLQVLQQQPELQQLRADSLDLLD
ncbi:PIP5K4 [Symbiodinium sp. CCMP2592]|nr:PIP5K4 [Symbiodinium sp. CCMP2592]